LLYQKTVEKKPVWPAQAVIWCNISVVSLWGTPCVVWK
jgi:hypothetical protein